MKVLFCWSRLCLVLGSPVPVCSLVSVCSSVRVPPFAPIPPQLPLSPHPGIQGHRGRGDTGPLAQDTGYKGYFFSWFGRYWWPKKEMVGSFACRIRRQTLILNPNFLLFIYDWVCSQRKTGVIWEIRKEGGNRKGQPAEIIIPSAHLSLPWTSTLPPDQLKRLQLFWIL